jgi:hypothetical protein
MIKRRFSYNVGIIREALGREVLYPGKRGVFEWSLHVTSAKIDID